MDNPNDPNDPFANPNVRFGGSRPVDQPAASAQPSVPADAPRPRSEIKGSADVTPTGGPSTWEDVKSTALGKTATSLSGMLGGGIGSVIKGGEDVVNMGRNAINYARKNLDYISPDEAERLNAKPLALPTFTPADEKGDSVLGILPTYKGVTSYMQDLSRQGVLSPELSHEPTSKTGKLTGSLIEGGVQSLPGVGAGMLGRALAGGLVSAAGTAGEIASKGQPAEGWFPIFTSVLGAVGAHKLTNAVDAFTNSSGIAQDALKKALAKDLAMDPTLSARLTQAGNNGLDVSVYDAAGPETRALLGAASGKNETQGLAQVGRINAALKLRSQGAEGIAGAEERTAKQLVGAIGSPVSDVGKINALALTKMAEEAGQAERNRIYELMKARPEANDIHLSDISSTVATDKSFQSAAQKATELADRMPEYNIVPPKPATYDYVRGMVVPPQPGNLSFYDMTQRLMREEAENLSRGDEASQILSNAVGTRRQNLLKDLEHLVPGYKDVRSKARDLFGTEEAPRAGFDFFSKVGTFKRKDILDALQHYTPEQRQYFKVGFADALQSKLGQENGLNTVRRMFENDDFAVNAKLALGEPEFAHLKGYVASEDLLRSVEELVPQAAPKSTIFEKYGPTFVGAGITGAGATALNFLTDAAFTGPAIAAGALAGATYSAIKGKANQMAARRMLELAMSQDPKKLQLLGVILDQQPWQARLFNKMSENLAAKAKLMAEGAQVGQEAARYVQPAPPAPPSAPPTSAEEMRARTMKMVREFNSGQATGGRVGYRAGGRILDHASKADALVRAAETARKQINGTTEPLLGMPDESVVKALAVANENI